MSPLRIGVLAAVVVAGPPLWLAVSEGDLTGWGAVGRGVMVAMACTLGAALVTRLLRGYGVHVRRAERDYLREAMAERLRIATENAARQREAERREQEVARREKELLKREREAELAARQAAQKATTHKGR